MFDNSSGPRQWLQIPPVTKNLIIINVIVWLAGILIPSFGNTLVGRLGLHYVTAPDFNPAQILTYMFLHSTQSPLHILFNMFTLWMFGRVLEQIWGSKRFLVFYLVCGVGAAFVQEIVWALTWYSDYTDAIARINAITPDHASRMIDAGLAAGRTDVTAGVASYLNSMVTIGASGSIFGLLLGFAFVFPDMPLYLFFIPVPVKARYMVIGYGVIEFFLGISSSASTVAHFAHLGGMIFGLVLLLYWKKKGILRGGHFY